MNHPHLDISNLTHRVDLFFIRHGETLGNRNHIIQGRTDYPLTETGMTLAHAAGSWFASQDIRQIYSSPLGRAMETARIIASEIGISGQDVESWDDLQEIDTGVFTDKSIAAIREEDPQAWRRFSRRSWEGVQGAETIAELEARALRVWNTLIARAGEMDEPARLLCVSHGGLIQWLFRVSLASGWDSWMPVIRVGNCGIFHFTIQPSAAPSSAGTASGAASGAGQTELPESDGASTGFYAEWKLINKIP